MIFPLSLKCTHPNVKPVIADESFTTKHQPKAGRLIRTFALWLPVCTRPHRETYLLVISFQLSSCDHLVAHQNLTVEGVNWSTLRKLLQDASSRARPQSSVFLLVCVPRRGASAPFSSTLVTAHEHWFVSELAYACYNAQTLLVPR